MTSPGRRTVDVALEAGATLGEGPVWESSAARLLWVDILERLVHSLDPASGDDVPVDVGQPVGAVAPRTAGGWVLAMDNGFAFAGPDGLNVELIAPVGEDDPTTRFNDGKCDPSGRFWAGTMAYDETPGAGSLYRLGTDRDVETVLTGVTISNGLAWSADRRTMYYVDSPTRRIDAFEYDDETGSITGRRPFVEIAPRLGMPDGMTIDAEGGLWVALWEGSAVHRYLPGGRLDVIVDVPATRVTSCTFGGPTLEELYITSARVGLSETDLAAQPHAGAVFVCRPGIAGTQAVPFAG